MKLQEIDEKLFDEFASNHKYASIYELSGWGKLKKTNGWDYFLLGMFDNDSLLGVTLLLSKNTLVRKKLFYSPRGYLIDASNYELLKEFNDLVIDFVKEHQGFMLKIDPNIIYNILDKDGVLIENVGDTEFNNYIKLGFKHFGFNKNFETLQPRYLCRFKLSNDYDETLNSFSKSTKKNIEKSINMGVCVRRLDIKETSVFTDVLNKTASEKDFAMRPTSYYEKMYELLEPYMNLYVTYIDTNYYYNNLLKESNALEEEYNELKKYMEKVNVGDKLKKQEESIIKRIDDNKKSIEYAKFLKTKGDVINIGALMSLFIGDDAVTFMSGTLSEYKDFYPKYAYYNEHIKEAIKRKKKYVNFYGISGDLSKKSKYYGIYEIKKGFNPEITELLGEFDYIINSFTYRLYKIALKLYKIKKKIFR